MILSILIVFLLLSNRKSSALHVLQSSKGNCLKLKLADDDYDEKSSFSKRRIRPRRISSLQTEAESQRRLNDLRREEALKDPTLLTSITFSDRIDLHPATKRALVEVMGLQEMTDVQAQTFPLILSGANVLGQARTGTGKTLAFLLPSLERLLCDSALYPPGGKTIGALVVVPTRELALQIADQAAAILTYHNDITVACFYGGTKIKRDINILRNNKRYPSILVATPGRLLDHLKETKISGRKFADIMGATNIVVLDEMDALLDMGFKSDILKILSYLPRRRQTLLFSATLPRPLRSLIDKVLGKDYKEVNCVDRTDITTLTNIRVKQHYIELPSMDHYLSALVKIIEEEMHNEHSKIVIFLPTTKLVAFFATYFESGICMPNIYRLHSRMSQAARQRTSEAFRTASNKSILITTDVSSRGVDYPDVTLVVQYGTPDNDTTYIHRLGRTGRAGKEGTGLQVVLPFEKAVVPKLVRRGIKEKKIPFTNSTSTSIDKVARTIRSGDTLLTPAASGAYKSFLAFYLERIDEFGLYREDIVDAANSFSKAVGLIRPPEFDPTIALRLGIADMVRLGEEK
mmetsp:Transcript_780/g.1093  ORF Transcript_780/g.1093 Transcript_780/m.1093 type:complete len:575 (+) Transcript_780:42-1766(+)